MATWITKRILIVVRTYPIPATKGIEVSCTAGITKEGEWARLFPVPYRFLDDDKRFKKYQWIDVDVSRPRADHRPESFQLNSATIKIIGSVPTVNEWRARKDVIFPLRRESQCQIAREQVERDFPTLGIFRPRAIKRLVMTPVDPNWTFDQQAILNQQLFEFGNSPARPLEKIPFEFRYEFKCADESCNGHKMLCTDWEMGQSYRRWKDEYGAGWEAKFRERFEKDMIEKHDTHFYVGTVHGHPRNWIIVGLFYPPRQAQFDLLGN